MDDFSCAMPPTYYSQPMAPRYPMQEYSGEAAHTLEDRSLPRDLTSFPPAQLDPSHAMNVYPPLPIGAERMLEYHPFPQDLPSFPPTNGVPAADPPDIERVNSDRQSEAPLPADAARWISMSPTQFDREYPGGNPFVIEELNLDSEEDPESASYVELDGARALNRIFVIFWAVELAIFPFWVPDIQREIIWAIVADLLKDGKIWLWVDGDEEQCWYDSHQDDILLKESREYVEQKLLCSSLWLRKPRLPTWTSLWERVSKASFAMRVSTITWATFTSMSVREAGWERGRADGTRCVLLETALRWCYPLLRSLGVCDLLINESRHSHLEVAFKDTLRRHGHSCYSSPEEPLKLLLYMRSFLCSTPSGKDVSMILFECDEACQQCAKLMKLYISSKDGHYTPPLSLLVLNDLRSALDIDTTAWLRILALGVSRGMISAAILSKMDDKIGMHLGTDEFDFEYQPWVNRLSHRLQRSVVACSESEWREAEHAVRRENQHVSVPTSRWDSMDIGLGVWITAIYLFMLEPSAQKLTPHRYWLDCYIQCGWDEVFDEPVYPAHIAASVEAICDVTSEASDFSTHTCCEFRWDHDGHPLKLRQCYSAAYLLLHPESQDVPFLDPLRLPVSCESCSFRRDKCFNCEQCRKLPGAEPLVPIQITASEATIPPAGGTDDIIPTLAVVRHHSPVSVTESQIPSTSCQSRASTLPKDVILPELKTHFVKLLAQHDIPIQYTNLGARQLPWCTLPELLKNRRLEIAGWPQDLPLPDATGKHNGKGIMGLTAKDARRLYEALPGISFRPMDKVRVRSRAEESEDDIGNRRPTKKVKGKGKAPAEGEKKFRLSEVQTVIHGIHVEKSN
ncbi:hypothetical protein BDZ89DRAFT_1079428 [Hymenopellis radicata]|nr:hypothetical protein BDZ89DRAFT_1079428 [Hymenopellis radicata]